jgi:hypothetical protein
MRRKRFQRGSLGVRKHGGIRVWVAQMVGERGSPLPGLGAVRSDEQEPGGNAARGYSAANQRRHGPRSKASPNLRRVRRRSLLPALPADLEAVD